MRNQMMTFLAAGHETAATSKVWTTHALSQPENKHSIPLPCRNPGRIPLQPTDDFHIRLDLKPEVFLTGRVRVLHPYSPVGVTLRMAAEDTNVKQGVCVEGHVRSALLVRHK